jgi:hypothetical protein
MTQQDPDLEVRKSASDILVFCCSQGEPGDCSVGAATFTSEWIPLLKNYAPTLIRTLLDSMVYSEKMIQVPIQRLTYNREPITIFFRPSCLMLPICMVQPLHPESLLETTSTMAAVMAMILTLRIGRFEKCALNPSKNWPEASEVNRFLSCLWNT